MYIILLTVVSFAGKIKRIGKEDFKIHKVVGKGSYGKVYMVEKMSKDGVKRPYGQSEILTEQNLTVRDTNG